MLYAILPTLPSWILKTVLIRPAKSAWQPLEWGVRSAGAGFLQEFPGLWLDGFDLRLAFRGDGLVSKTL